MLKGITVVCVVLSLCACVSIGSWKTDSASPEKADLNYWVTPPTQNELVFIGVSSRQIKPDAEVASAREDAAKKVSMYHGIRADVEAVQNVGTGYLDYFANSKIAVEYDQQIEQYLDKLTFDPDRDVFTRNNVVFIRFTYPAAFPGNISYHFDKNPNGSPKWTSSPPSEIGGFMAGVGFARRQQRIRDTIVKSYESAVASLVTRISSSITASDTSTFTQGTSFFHQQSEGRLANFLVIETWIDPSTEAVWTLAVARNAD